MKSLSLIYVNMISEWLHLCFSIVYIHDFRHVHAHKYVKHIWMNNCDFSSF